MQRRLRYASRNVGAGRYGLRVEQVMEITISAKPRRAEE